MLTITGNITLDPDPDLDPHPNWAKFLDPDPNSIYLDPQHWWLAWLLTWQTPSWVRGTPSITPRVAFFFIGVNAFFTFDSLSWIRSQYHNSRVCKRNIWNPITVDRYRYPLVSKWRGSHNHRDRYLVTKVVTSGKCSGLHSIQNLLVLKDKFT